MKKVLNVKDKTLELNELNTKLNFVIKEVGLYFRKKCKGENLYYSLVIMKDMPDTIDKFDLISLLFEKFPKEVKKLDHESIKSEKSIKIPKKTQEKINTLLVIKADISKVGKEIDVYCRELCKGKSQSESLNILHGMPETVEKCEFVSEIFRNS
jgi:hypothetical protein